ncbi:hypothetical protein EPUS_06300 [Endocarpon pusillum Z07020]|uniref:Uncharacterized protein n=1 Tax=Endocarpon pusillum (strain Z07020 / HMAS-L-300199) TaxID=1263415 RepID=U1GHC0_ENDPU|nr:uncharacterized protein EPUS_06300 [Endocarpon pusillum Z07020]ERF77082.1 hypothetical protein EPUS_06300 [Endocarpon pusillum Z07020]
MKGKAQTKPQLKPSTKRKRQSDANTDAGEPKKRQRHDSDQAISTPNHSETTLNKTAHSFPRPHALNRLSKIALQPRANNEVLTDGGESMQEQRNSLMFAENEDKVEDNSLKTQCDDNGGCENDLLNASIPRSSQEAVKESLKLKEVEDMTNEYFGRENLHEKGLAIDVSIESNAAQIWPRCARPCQNCRSTHVAIPGSTISQDCVKISMFIYKEPASVTDQTKRQNSLVPTDEYELAVLGWLIWSTYEHRMALRDATLGMHPKGNRWKHYIRTELVRSGNKSCWDHLSKAQFQNWWNGRKNLKSCSGMRWLNVTFDWDMGDTDLPLASFGSMGRLFSLPQAKLSHGICSKTPTDKRVKPPTENQSGCVEVAEGIQDNKSSHGDDDTGDRDSKVDTATAEDKEAKHGVEKLGVGDLEKAEGQSSRTGSTIHQFREKSPSSSDTSSQGDDDDFM